MRGHDEAMGDNTQEWEKKERKKKEERREKQKRMKGMQLDSIAVAVMFVLFPHFYYPVVRMRVAETCVGSVWFYV